MRRTLVGLAAACLLLRATAAHADIILLEDHFEFGYEFSARPHQHEYDTAFDGFTFAGLDETQLFWDRFTGAAFNGEGGFEPNSFRPTIRPEPPEGSPGYGESANVIAGLLSSESDLTFGAGVFAPDLGAYWDYAASAYLDLVWTFTVDSPVSLWLAGELAEGLSTVSVVLANLTLGTELENALLRTSTREFGTNELLDPGYVYQLQASIRSPTTGGDGSFATFNIRTDAEFAPPPVPEPASLALVGSALAGIAGRRWMRRRRAQRPLVQDGGGGPA